MALPLQSNSPTQFKRTKDSRRHERRRAKHNPILDTRTTMRLRFFWFCWFDSMPVNRTMRMCGEYKWQLTAYTQVVEVAWSPADKKISPSKVSELYLRWSLKWNPLIGFITRTRENDSMVRIVSGSLFDCLVRFVHVKKNLSTCLPEIKTLYVWASRASACPQCISIAGSAAMLY